MSQENVEIMRQSLAAFDRRDRAAWLAFRDPNHDVITSATWPEAGDIRGREAAWDFYLEETEPFDQIPLSDATIEPCGSDKVLVHHRNRVRGRASGADVELDYWVVVTSRDGTIIRDEWFEDRTAALKAAGLSE